MLKDLENSDGYIIDRNSETVADEIQRIKDTLLLHGNWLDDNLEMSMSSMTENKIQQARKVDRNYIAIGGIVAFFVMIILLSRYVKGEYR